MATFRWVQGCRVFDMEVLTAKGQLKIAKATIEELKKSNYSRGEKVEIGEGPARDQDP